MNTTRNSPSHMSRTEFMRCFGSLYEHSPWIAATVYDRGLDRDHDDPAALHEAFRRAVMDADREAQLQLLRAHPPLAAGLRQGLSDASRREQSGAGLDACSAEELAAFRDLNAAYERRFGFPFIVAVRGRSREQILRLLRERIGRDAETELATALEQVCLIGKHRLAGVLHG